MNELMNLLSAVSVGLFCYILSYLQLIFYSYTVWNYSLLTENTVAPRLQGLYLHSQN